MILTDDSNILLSYCNTLLRDKYGSLGELCEEEDVSQSELEERLLAAGYRYDGERNAFRPV